MLINFSHQLFKTKLDCSAVSLDGYSPSNLLSSNWRERNQGFMAAHFIKPPVFLLFQFAFPIQLHSVVMKPKVGSQMATGFDLLVAGIKPEASESAFCRRKTGKYCEDNRIDQQQQQQQAMPIRNKRKRKCDDLEDKTLTKRGNFGEKLHELKILKMQEIPESNYSTTVTIESFKNSHRNLFTLVSRINKQDGKTLGIVNRRCSEAQSSSTFEGDFEHDFFHASVLSYVTHLMLIINRVKGSCVPCLGMIEICGKPYVNCDKSIIDCVYEIQKKIKGQHGSFHGDCSTKANVKESTCSTVEKGNDIVNDNDDIPNDFRDPITCNLMTIPMLLPSGLNIDMTTLEKHNNTERQWGRMPSDPFTGVVFTNTVKPIPNSALKVRIDKYILSSGADVTGYGRALGRVSIPNKHDRNNSMMTSNKSKFANCRLGGRDGKLSCSSIDSGKWIKEDNVNTELTSMTKLVNKRTSHSGTVATKSTVVENYVQVTLPHSHEEQVSNSLDDALTKTLQGAIFSRKQATCTSDSGNASCSSLIQDGNACTSHTISPSTQSMVKAQEPKTCIQCKVALDIAFKLPCQHLLCRKCLLLKCSSTKKPICSMCKHPFLRREAIRVHMV